HAQQTMGTGHSADPARFRNVKVGSADTGNGQRITVARLAATGRPLAQQFTKRAAIFNWACDLLLSAQALSVKKPISPAANRSAGQQELAKSEGLAASRRPRADHAGIQFFMHLGSGNSIYLTKELVTCADS